MESSGGDDAADSGGETDAAADGERDEDAAAPPAPEDDEMVPLGEFIAKATGQIDEMRLVAGTGVGASATVDSAGSPSVGAPPAFVSRPSTPLKDRFNYLNKNAGAKLLAAAPEVSNAYQVLSEDKDTYAMAEREVKRKWITLALSQEIHLDTIVLANFELYSCHVRRFQILGSQTYPCQQWALLGEFTANDTRSEQVFHMTQPLFVRYLKLRFLTHYGSEHYWSLSLVRAYGQTDIDKFHSDTAQLQEAKQRCDCRRVW